MPRSPSEAKGLLLASIRDPNPVVFLEPKALYRSAVEEVDEGDYMLPLSKASIVRPGHDVTVIGWGGGWVYGLTTTASLPLPLPH